MGCGGPLTKRAYGRGLSMVTFGKLPHAAELLQPNHSTPDVPTETRFSLDFAVKWGLDLARGWEPFGETLDRNVKGYHFTPPRRPPRGLSRKNGNFVGAIWRILPATDAEEGPGPPSW
jgi:hypothetical protein